MITNNDFNDFLGLFGITLLVATMLLLAMVLLVILMD